MEPRVQQLHAFQVEPWFQPHFVPATCSAVELVPPASDKLLSLSLPACLVSLYCVAVS